MTALGQKNMEILNVRKVGLYKRALMEIQDLFVY